MLIVSTRALLGRALARELEGLGTNCQTLGLAEVIARCAQDRHVVVIHCHGRDPEIVKAVHDISRTAFTPAVVVVTAEGLADDSAWMFWSDAGAADAVHEDQILKLKGIVRRELRRSGAADRILRTFSGGRLDLARGTYDGRATSVRLSRQDLATVTALMGAWQRSANGWASSEAVRQSWPDAAPPQASHVPVLIHRVTAKLTTADATADDPDPPQWIESARRRGYRLRRQPPNAQDQAAATSVP